MIARDLLGMFAAADLVLFRGLDVPDVAPTPVVAVGGMAFVIAFWGVPITHVVAAWHARQIHEAEARVGVDCQQLLGDAIVPDTIPRDQV